ncbi:MAG: hypothetical protein CMJ83_07935 [Planctomycetes bacterium]|nr:hypothetical protein [Planctomycetota bacterium]
MSRPILIVFLLVLVGGTVRSQEPGADLGDRVRKLFIDKCAECHGPRLRRAKGRFGYVDDLEKVVKSYVKKGDPRESELWWYLTGEPELMPPEKKGGPLSTDELAVVWWWIAAGAPTSSTPPAVKTAPASKPLVGPFHVVLVHFPIALVLAALLAEVLYLVSGSAGLRTAAALCLGLGAASGVLAGYSGWVLAEACTEAEVADHRWTGVATVCLTVLAWGCLAASRRGKQRWATLLYRLLLLAAAILVGISGHLGGVIVHGADHLPL